MTVLATVRGAMHKHCGNSITRCRVFYPPPTRPAAGPWASPLPRLLPFLPADRTPMSGPMLGCSAIYAPGGATLARAAAKEEGLVLAHLPLLPQQPQRQRQHEEQHRQQQRVSQQQGGSPRVEQPQHEEELSTAPAPPPPPPASPAPPAPAAGGDRLSGTPLAAVLGAAAAASADAGPGVPYARYSGGFVAEPVSWHMRYGFPLMEALGSLSYHCWRAGLRASVARSVTADGVWRGPLPQLGPA